MFCPVSGLVGRLWQLNFYSNVPDISHTPSFFSHVEISHTLGLNRNEREGARSVWFGCHWFFFIFSAFPFRYPPSLFYISIFPSVSFLGTGLLWLREVRWFGENIGASIVAKSWQIAERPPKDWRRCGSYVCERIGWAGISSIFTSIFFSYASKEPAWDGVRKGKRHLVVICLVACFV